jgi:hypothetical protein
MVYSNISVFMEPESQSNRRPYDPCAFTLAQTYGIAFLLSGVANALGMRALVGHRTFRPISSQRLLTTHNPEMDRWIEARSRLVRPTMTNEELTTRMTHRPGRGRKRMRMTMVMRGTKSVITSTPTDGAQQFYDQDPEQVQGTIRW